MVILPPIRVQVTKYSKKMRQVKVDFPTPDRERDVCLAGGGGSGVCVCVGGGGVSFTG